MNEKPWDQRGERSERRDPPDKIDPLMLISFSYADFWSAIGGEDAAQAFEKGLTATYEGSHPLYVCEDQNTLGIPAEMLVKTFYPDALFKHPLVGAQNLVSFDKARQLVGFTPENHIGDWLNSTDTQA